MQKIVMENNDAKIPSVVREHNIGNTKYIVKSVFIGKKDIKTTLLKLAEQKAIREMGLDGTCYPTE